VLLAAPAYASAPMCDEQAQSIAAPLPVIPHDAGWIRGCQRPTFDDSSPGQTPNPGRSGVAPDRLDPAVLEAHRLPPRAKPERMARPEPERPGLPILVSEIYRPPR
jgi:hypothetical protein